MFVSFSYTLPVHVLGTYSDFQCIFLQLSDFGLAKLKKISLSSTGRANKGTPTHTPPEILMGKAEYSEKTDVWR